MFSVSCRGTLCLAVRLDQVAPRKLCGNQQESAVQQPPANTVQSAATWLLVTSAPPPPPPTDRHSRGLQDVTQQMLLSDVGCFTTTHTHLDTHSSPAQSHAQINVTHPLMGTHAHTPVPAAVVCEAHPAPRAAREPNS